MTSPDPLYALKKAQRDRLIRLSAYHPEWVLGFEDEVWWSRVAQPSLHAWTADTPMQVQLLQSDASDPDPDAVACYGFLRHDTHKVLLRFVEGRPLGELTVQFLEWLCGCVAQEQKHVLVVIWDNASWHTSEEVAGWVKEQNQRAKRAIIEVDRKLTAAEITNRVCEHFGCELLPYLKTDLVGDGALKSSAL